MKRQVSGSYPESYKQYEIGEVIDVKVLIVPCTLSQEEFGFRCGTRKKRYCPNQTVLIKDVNGLHIMGYCKPKEKAYLNGSAILETFRRHKKPTPTPTKEHSSMDQRKT